MKWWRSIGSLFSSGMKCWRDDHTYINITMKHEWDVISLYNVSMTVTCLGHMILHLVVSEEEVKSGLMMLEQDWFFHFFYVDVHETRPKVTMLESYVLHSKEQGMGQENY